MKIIKFKSTRISDVCDLIWMSKFRTGSSIEDIIVELVGIFNNINVGRNCREFFANALRCGLENS